MKYIISVPFLQVMFLPQYSWNRNMVRTLLHKFGDSFDKKVLGVIVHSVKRKYRSDWTMKTH